MKASNIEVKIIRTVIEIDGESYNKSVILNFFDDAHKYKDSIRKTGNWFNHYLYLEIYFEKGMERMLLRRKVILLNPNHTDLHEKIDAWNALTNRNKRPGLNKQMEPCNLEKRYLLDEGFDEFYREVWDVINELEKLNR